MTDRNKLICIMSKIVPLPFHQLTRIADHLTDHGVTVQKWIPVTERFPEEDGHYLVYKFSPFGSWCEVARFARDGRKVDEYDFEAEWENVWYGYDSEYGYITYDSVTHWMPLPEPPKEV